MAIHHYLLTSCIMIIHRQPQLFTSLSIIPSHNRRITTATIVKSNCTDGRITTAVTITLLIHINKEPRTDATSILLQATRGRIHRDDLNKVPNGAAGKERNRPGRRRVGSISTGANYASSSTMLMEERKRNFLVLNLKSAQNKSYIHQFYYVDVEIEREPDPVEYVARNKEV